VGHDPSAGRASPHRGTEAWPVSAPSAPWPGARPIGAAVGRPG